MNAIKSLVYTPEFVDIRCLRFSIPKANNHRNDYCRGSRHIPQYGREANRSCGSLLVRDSGSDPCMPVVVPLMNLPLHLRLKFIKR